MEQTVLVSINSQGVAILKLNRPQAANSLSKQMLIQLQSAITECQSNPSVRSVILIGEGDKIFCAGADLKERIDMNETEVYAAVTLIRDTINQLESLAKPVIAAINGAAFGGGLEIALACDIRIAAQTAKLGLTETSLGIIPGAGGTQRLPRLIGIGRAKELIYTARRVEAEEALCIGLVEYVTPPEALLERALAIAEQIARNAPIAVSQAKIAIDHGWGKDIRTGLSIEQIAYEVTVPTKDRLEGLQAFREQRRPIFKGE
jgi:enoyl-CoA hydratase/carnithine racemase